MTQAATFSVPTTGPASPDAFALRVDDNFTAALTLHSGSSRPTYAEPGTIWQDTSLTNTARFYLYDGSDDNLLYTVNTSTGVVTWAGLPPSNSQTFGQCQLSLSGGNLLLSRLGGKLLTINGAHESIPSAGVTLAATGLTPSTLYYIYAYMSSGTMTLEASTTGHATDSTTGVEIKSGDATRTLVGMARPVTGPAWVYSATQRFVLSWFNRRTVPLYNAFTANRTRALATMDELNTEIRCEFLTWANEAVDAVANAMVSSGAGAGISIYSSVAFDGVSDNDAFIELQTISTGYISALPVRNVKNLTEGYHYATLGGGTSSGTATWYGASAGSRRTQLNVSIRG